MCESRAVHCWTLPTRMSPRSCDTAAPFTRACRLFVSRDSLRSLERLFWDAFGTLCTASFEPSSVQSPETSLQRVFKIQRAFSTRPVWHAGRPRLSGERAQRVRDLDSGLLSNCSFYGPFFSSLRERTRDEFQREERASRKALQNTLDRSYPREPRHQVWAQNLENLYIRRIANRKKVC